MAQRENETTNPALLTVGLDLAQVTPIDLGLLPRGRLETSHRDRAGDFPQRLQVILEDRVAAVVAVFSQLAQQHDGVPNACPEAFFDEWLQAVQLRRPWLARAVARH
jgi:hypothetical protein